MVAGAGESAVAGVDVAGAGEAGGVDADEEGDWLDCPVAGEVVVWDCGWLGPHAVNSSAAAAAAVVMANPWDIF